MGEAIGFIYLLGKADPPKFEPKDGALSFFKYWHEAYISEVKIP